jgi:hypothetical protein
LHPLSLANGAAAISGCTAPSSSLISNVVYLTGALTVPSGFDGQIAVLPSGSRPAHTLYMTSMVGSAASASYFTVVVFPSGVVSLFAPTATGGGDDFLTLGGLSFHLGS